MSFTAEGYPEFDEPFPGSAADFYEQIQKLKAEIKRLETINSSRTFLYLEARSLITELCDALEEEYGSVRGDGHMSNLLIRAREAVK